MSLYNYVLGILELLEPQVFHKENNSLDDVLEEYFSLLSVSGYIVYGIVFSGYRC